MNELNKKHFFSTIEESKIIDAIQKAEKNTSGEIKVHIEEHCYIDLLDRSSEIFAKLKMHETEQRNGVLIYLAKEDHIFSIIGDLGINAVIDVDFWDDVRDIMESNFREGDLVKGLVEGILKAGEKLQAFFPYKDDDTNELTDDLSYG